MNFTWLIFSLLSAFTAALVAIFGKIGLKDIDTNVATAIRVIVMTIFLLIIVFMQGNVFDKFSSIFSNNKAMIYIVLSGIAGALSWLFYFLALKIGKVYQVTAIDRLSLVFAIILAIIFLGEKISLKAGIGAALMIFGAILIAIGS